MLPSARSVASTPRSVHTERSPRSILLSSQRETQGYTGAYLRKASIGGVVQTPGRNSIATAASATDTPRSSLNDSESRERERRIRISNAKRRKAKELAKTKKKEQEEAYRRQALENRRKSQQDYTAYVHRELKKQRQQKRGMERNAQNNSNYLGTSLITTARSKAPPHELAKKKIAIESQPYLAFDSAQLVRQQTVENILLPRGQVRSAEHNRDRKPITTTVPTMRERTHESVCEDQCDIYESVSQTGPRLHELRRNIEHTNFLLESGPPLPQMVGNFDGSQHEDRQEDQHQHQYNGHPQQHQHQYKEQHLQRHDDQPQQQPDYNQEQAHNHYEQQQQPQQPRNHFEQQHQQPQQEQRRHERSPDVSPSSTSSSFAEVYIPNQITNSSQFQPQQQHQQIEYNTTSTAATHHTRQSHSPGDYCSEVSARSMFRETAQNMNEARGIITGLMEQLERGELEDVIVEDDSIEMASAVNMPPETLIPNSPHETRLAVREHPVQSEPGDEQNQHTTTATMNEPNTVNVNNIMSIGMQSAVDTKKVNEGASRAKPEHQHQHEPDRTGETDRFFFSSNSVAPPPQAKYPKRFRRWNVGAKAKTAATPQQLDASVKGERDDTNRPRWGKGHETRVEKQRRTGLERRQQFARKLRASVKSNGVGSIKRNHENENDSQSGNNQQLRAHKIRHSNSHAAAAAAATPSNELHGILGDDLESEERKLEESLARLDTKLLTHKTSSIATSRRDEDTQSHTDSKLESQPAEHKNQQHTKREGPKLPPKSSRWPVGVEGVGRARVRVNPKTISRGIDTDEPHTSKPFTESPRAVASQARHDQDDTVNNQQESPHASNRFLDFSGAIDDAKNSSHVRTPSPPPPMPPPYAEWGEPQQRISHADVEIRQTRNEQAGGPQQFSHLAQSQQQYHPHHSQQQEHRQQEQQNRQQQQHNRQHRNQQQDNQQQHNQQQHSQHQHSPQPQLGSRFTDDERIRDTPPVIWEHDHQKNNNNNNNNSSNLNTDRYPHDNFDNDSIDNNNGNESPQSEYAMPYHSQNIRNITSWNTPAPLTLQPIVTNALNFKAASLQQYKPRGYVSHPTAPAVGFNLSGRQGLGGLFNRAGSERRTSDDGSESRDYFHEHAASRSCVAPAGRHDHHYYNRDGRVEHDNQSLFGSENGLILGGGQDRRFRGRHVASKFARNEPRKQKRASGLVDHRSDVGQHPQPPSRFPPIHGKQQQQSGGTTLMKLDARARPSRDVVRTTGFGHLVL